MVEIKNPKISSSAFYVYIIPLVVMVIGVLVGLQIGRGAGFDDFAEIISVATGIVFLVLSYILLGQFDRRKKNSQPEESLVQMKEIINEKRADDEQND